MAINRGWALAGACSLALLAQATESGAQIKDVTQVPNAANVGIRKSFTAQIGAGRGDLLTPESSLFIINRDPFRAVRRGNRIFHRKFLVSQGLGPVTNDGVGDISADPTIGAGLADSCASCHGRPKGSAGVGGDVFTRPDSRDAPHLFGLGLVEMLGDEITRDLRAIRDRAVSQAMSRGAAVELPLRSKGIGFGSIRALPNGTVDTTLVQGVNPDLRVRPFFAEGSTMSIREFTVGAFNAEMGLESPDSDLLLASSGGVVTTPTGMVLDGRIDRIERPPVASPAEDGDGDGKVNEIPVSAIDFVEYYLVHYFKPGTYQQTTESILGRVLFNQIGCTTCHVPNLRIDRDRRVADVETTYDPSQNGLNGLFANASSFTTTLAPDGSGFPPVKRALNGSFLVRNFFSDLKRHDLGKGFHELQFNNTLLTKMVTEPLWGVATTAPYGHDGRSINLEEVILRHGGEAQASRDAYADLPREFQSLVTKFLSTLILFPPDDTASNLVPANPAAPDFPQRGHGAISLTPLFNDPTDVE